MCEPVVRRERAIVSLNHLLAALPLPIIEPFDPSESHS